MGKVDQASRLVIIQRKILIDNTNKPIFNIIDPGVFHIEKLDKSFLNYFTRIRLGKITACMK